MEELLARVRAALRRSAADGAPLVVEAGDVRLDITERRATRADEEVRLTPTEWHIVEVLARREGRLVRQAELLHEVWGPGYDRETNYLRVFLAQLRRKLEKDPSRPTLFITDPGIGYRLVV
jgi:two-component system KDP operon response regulator KdpE